jgi:hypothetical protein
LAQVNGGKSATWRTPLPFLQGVLLPGQDGSLRLLSPNNGADAVLPFYPPIQPLQMSEWHRPCVVGADRDAAVAATDAGHIVRVGIKAQPRPHLALQTETHLPDKVVSPLVALQDHVFLICRRADGDAVLTMSAETLRTAAEFPQTGRRLWGPLPVEQGVVAAFSPGTLICWNADREVRWTVSTPGAARLGEPVVAGKEWLFPSADGKVLRLNPADGTWLEEVPAPEPLGPMLVTVGNRLLVAAADGTLLLLPWQAGT